MAKQEGYSKGHGDMFQMQCQLHVLKILYFLGLFKDRDESYCVALHQYHQLVTGTGFKPQLLTGLINI